MHCCADRLGYHGAVESFDAHAHWVGILGKEHFDFLVTNNLLPGGAEPKIIPVGPTSYRRSYQRRKRTDGEVSKMLVSAERLSSASNRPASYFFGYIEGIGDGLGWVMTRETELHDFRARQAMADFVGVLYAHLEKLMIGNVNQKFFWSKNDQNESVENRF